MVFNFIKSYLGFNSNSDEVMALGFATKKIPYYFNDPSTGALFKEMDMPVAAKLPFSVSNYKLGEAVVKNTEKADAAGCYYTINNSINYLDKIVSQYKVLNYKWAGTKHLLVQPRAGKTMNAYYDRKYLKFFYDTDPVTKKNVYTSKSADIVAHETGHGLLDFLRPDFWDVQSMEIWGFHESFGDIMAILSIMQFDEILEALLKETGGDLRKSNIISKLAEEMGNALFHMRYSRTPGALRDAVNNFKYSPPNSLPKDAPDDQLSSECHSFSRVFTGAFYDIMVGIYETECSNHTKIEALKIARDAAATYVFIGVIQAPRTNRFYESIARSMIAIDKSKKSKYATVLNNVFAKRNILNPEIKMLSTEITWDSIFPTVKKNDQVIKKLGSKMISVSTLGAVKLSDYYVESLSSHSNINLSNLNLDVASDAYYEFNDDGFATFSHVPDKYEIMEEARNCVDTIKNDISQEAHTAWEINKNNLKRSFIECDFCS